VSILLSLFLNSHLHHVHVTRVQIDTIAGLVDCMHDSCSIVICRNVAADKLLVDCVVRGIQVDTCKPKIVVWSPTRDMCEEELATCRPSTGYKWMQCESGLHVFGSVKCFSRTPALFELCASLASAA